MKHLVLQNTFSAFIATPAAQTLLHELPIGEAILIRLPKKSDNYYMRTFNAEGKVTYHLYLTPQGVKIERIA